MENKPALTRVGVSRREFLRLGGLTVGGVLLAACGAPPGAPEGTEGEPTGVAPTPESVELFFVTPGTNNSSEALYKPISDRFREVRPDITVRWLGVPNDEGWGPYFDRLLVLKAGGETIDMAVIPIEGTRLFTAQRAIMPLDAFIDVTPELEEYFEDVSPKLVDVFVYGGQTYALPYDFNNMVIWMNTARLEEEGLEVPPEDWTFDDFRNYASTLTRRDGDQVTHWGFDFWTSPFGLCPWLFNNGLDGMMVGDALEIPQMTRPEYVEVVQMLYDLIYVDQSVPVDAGGTISLESGTQAMEIAGRWKIADYLESGFEDWTVQYWPTGTRRVTNVGVGAWPIFSDSANARQAWDLYVWMLNKDSATYLASKGANIPARRSVGYSDAVVNAQPSNGRIWYESIDRDDIPVIGVTAPPDYSEMEAISNRYLGQIFGNELSVQEGLEACQAEIEEMVARRPSEWAEIF